MKLFYCLGWGGAAFACSVRTRQSAQVAARYVDVIMTSLVKPGLSVPMTVFALQGTHPSTGSSRRQVCDVFTMSLVKPGLRGFLWLSLLCRPGTLRLTGVVSTALTRI